MTQPNCRTKVISITTLLVFIIGGIFVPAQRAQASAILPNMAMTLSSGGSTYASTVFVGNTLVLTASIKNTGNVPLQVTANTTTPQNWDLEADKDSNCQDSLAVQKTCTIIWAFIPQASGQVILRVYARATFTDATGATNRIVQSPAFIFNVKPAKATAPGSTPVPGTSPTPTAPSVGGLPNMSVTLISGNSTYASTVFAGKPLIFQAQVKNTGKLPLALTANLTVPKGWDLEADKDSDCPVSLEAGKSCTFNWSFTPQAAGQVFLRVYVRGVYTLASGVSNRITQSPAFIFNVKPAKPKE